MKIVIIGLGLLGLLSACGEAPPTEPGPLPPGPVVIKYYVAVTETKTIGASCPTGFLANHVSMEFWLNGDTNRLVFSCEKIKTCQ